MTVPQAPVDELPPDPDAARVEAQDEAAAKRNRNIIEWVVIVGAALIAAMLIKTFLIQAFYIPSESMDPTLKISDRVLVNKLSYTWGDVKRGHIVVFERPPAETGGDPAIKDLIKRIVALPGDKVEGREGHVWINDKQLDEPYLPDEASTLDFPAQVIPADHYWVMGDNRLRSRDSRYFGPIADDLIVGRAFVRIWPINKLGRL
jgi:signal peptidase I